jgi:proteasome lid subunit RPN8/RPN11
VPRRVEVDETIPEAEIEPRILNELSAHARETLPEECCGLIFGDEGERYRLVVRCRNEMNQQHLKDPVRYPRDARQAYYITPEQCHQELRKEEKMGRRLTAVYHSHVDTGPYLSELDVECAEQYAEDDDLPLAQADQIVIAVSEDKVRALALFRRIEPGGAFKGCRIAWGRS